MTEDWLNIALPKGRLGDQAYKLLEQNGYECPAIYGEGRKLFFENTEKKLRYFWVKPSDVAVYVERGSADLGIVGSDILREYEPDVYELEDLKIGRCAMCVAGPKGERNTGGSVLRVASKFTHTASRYYESLGQDIDIIRLNGSVELAPILGLSDVIVDIVETGKTLKENGLEVYETIMPISARLIANRVSYKFLYERVRHLSSALSENLQKEESNK